MVHIDLKEGNNMDKKVLLIAFLAVLLTISTGFIAIQQIEKQKIQSFNEGYVAGFQNATLINYNQIVSSLITNGYVDLPIQTGNQTQLLRLVPQGV